MGALAFSGYFGLLGIIGWLGLNLLVAYKFNQARIHSRPEAYDDRLTDERIQKSQEELMKRWEEKKEKK